MEENLHTDNFKLMPDGIIRLYDYLNDLETVASALAESHILVTGLSVSGDTLEDYFFEQNRRNKKMSKSPKKLSYISCFTVGIFGELEYSISF